MKTFSLKSSPATSASKPSNESEAGAAENANIFGCYARTVNYRRFYLFQMICLPFIPIMALFFQNLTIFLEQINVYEETRNVNQEVKFSLRILGTFDLTCKFSFLNRFP